MTTPFTGGVGANTNVGTAHGKVRIEYESVGAPRVVSEVTKVTEAVAMSTSAMEQMGKASGSLGQYAQINQMGRTIETWKNQLARQALSVNLGFEQKSILEQAAVAHELVQGVFDTNHINLHLSTATTLESAIASHAAIQRYYETNPIKLSTKGAGVGVSGVGSGIGSNLAEGFGSGALIGTVGRLGSLIGVAAAATSAVALVGYTLTKGFERQENIDSAATKMRALGYTAQQTQSIMKSALDSVNQTAFSLDEAAQTAVQALAAGVPGGEQLTNYLKSIANTAALAKTSMIDMGYYFNQVAAAGKLQGQQLDELIYKGVPILQYLGDEYGVTQEKAREMVNAGGVDFAHFEDAINKHTKGIADTMGQSISGSIDNLRTAIARLGAAALQPIFGSATGDMSNFAKVVQDVQHAVDGLSHYLSQHQAGLIEFWADTGHAVILMGHGVIDTVDIIIHAIGDLAKGVGGAVDAFADVSDFFGAHGTADNAHKAADAINEWGNSVNRHGNSLYSWNAKLDQADRSIGTWAKGATDAAKHATDFANAFPPIAAKGVAFTDFLEKLNIKQDAADKGITGTTAQFKEFIATVVNANAPKDLVDLLVKMHQEFNESGHSAADFGNAIDKLGDSSLSADEKAKSLITAMKEMGQLPNGDSLRDYNDTLRAATDWQSKLVDHLDLTGGALINLDGTINSSSKNGSKLEETFENIREKAYALAASDAKIDYSQTWERTRQGLLAVANQFGLTGDAAEQLISKYLLPEKDFEILFKAKNETEVQKELSNLLLQMDAAKRDGKNQLQFEIGGVDQAYAKQLQEVLTHFGATWDAYNPDTKIAKVTVPPDSELAKQREKIGQVFANDPAKLDSILDVTTTKQDILTKVLGGDTSLKIPTILDIQNLPGQPGQPPPPGSPPPPASESPKPSPSSPPPVLSPQQKADQGNAGAPLGLHNDPGPNPYGPSGSPLDPKTLTGQGILDHLRAEAEAREKNKTGIEKFSEIFSDHPGPDYTFGHQGGAFVAPGASNYQHLLDVSKNPNAIQTLLGGHPDLQATLQAPVLDAVKSGKSFSQAFADGINSNNDAVIRAIMELAGLAGDGLGRSPAKYGPLSGEGWTFYRGQTFSLAWAQGIASQSDAIKTSVSGIGHGAGATLDDSLTSWVKNMTQISKFGQGLSGLVTQVAQIGLGFGKVFNTLSGGRLSPKNYRIDPTIDTRRNPLGTWAPGQAGLPPGSGGGGYGAPAGLAANAGPQDIANYIITKALSLGFSREQANAIATQAYGESAGFKPQISGGVQGDDEVIGIFQEKAAFAKAGGIDPSQRGDPQKNIDAYFNHLMAAGGPAAGGDIKSMLANISGGGPAHPTNVGHWDRAVAGVAPFLAGFQPTSALGATPFGGDASLLSKIPVGHYDPSGDLAKGLGDCSSAVEDLYNFMRGQATEGRSLNTGNAVQWLTQRGFMPTNAPVAGAFNVAFSPSHMQATLPGGTNFNWGSEGAANARGLAPNQGAYDPNLPTKYYLPVSSAGAGPPAAPVPAPQTPSAPPTPSPATPSGGKSYTPDDMERARALAADTDNLEGYKKELRGEIAGAMSPGTKAALGEILGITPSTAPKTPAAPSSPGAPTPPVGTPPKPAAPAGWQKASGGWKFFQTDPNGPDKGKTYWLSPDLAVGAEPQIQNGIPTLPGNTHMQVTGNDVVWWAAGNTPMPVHPALPAGATPEPAPTTPTAPQTPTTPTQPTPPGVGTPQSQFFDPSVGPMGAYFAQHPELQAALSNSAGLNATNVIPLLQTLDSAIADQNRIAKSAPTGSFNQDAADAKQIADSLSSVKSNLQSQFGLQEAPSGLEQAESFISGASGIISDVFGTFDSVLQAVSATQNATDILTHGVANTKDVMKLVDDFQTYLTVAQKGLQTAGDITSFVGSFTQGAGGFGDAGATQAVGQLLSLSSQVVGAINTGIDLAQEGYQLVTQQLGKVMTEWLGFPNANNIYKLLDLKTGQLHVYTDNIPSQYGTTFNTLGRQGNQGQYLDQRVQPYNHFDISMAPGQDPMDMMNDIGFAIRQSGIGALGYDTSKPAGITQ